MNDDQYRHLINRLEMILSLLWSISILTIIGFGILMFIKK